eukprot:g73969.t1
MSNFLTTRHTPTNSASTRGSLPENQKQTALVEGAGGAGLVGDFPGIISPPPPAFSPPDVSRAGPLVRRRANLGSKPFCLRFFPLSVVRTAGAILYSITREQSLYWSFCVNRGFCLSA